MSYILDALQRADAERERGQIPGLRSRSAPWVREPRPHRTPAWPLLASIIALATLLLVAWWFWRPAVPSTTTGVVLAPATTAPAPVPVEPGPGAVAAGEAPAAGSSLPILSPSLQGTTPAGPAQQPPRAQSAVQPVETSQAVATQPTGAAASPVPDSSLPPPQEARIPSFGELSADVRARLPQVSVSGATYSANPAHRMLIVNGQVLQEGQEIQSGLRLESIGPRSATLEHQGLRYTIGY